MITTVDNFDSKFFNIEENGNIFSFNARNENYFFSFSKKEKDVYITYKQYKENQNNFFTLSNDKSSDDDLILSMSSYQKNGKEKNYAVSVGNYIGKFKYKNVDINIKSRFSDIFLKRMLNFANDVYIDDVDVSGQVTEKADLDYSKFIIYYMFIQKLEKEFLLGLPRSYVSVNHHEMKVKGKIDINRFIKYDIPFKGKVSSTSREQKEIQEIIDVLYKAISIIDKQSVISTQNISHIKIHLKQYKSRRYVSTETISKAIKSKALHNPIFSPYKKVLEYAKLIINANNLEEKKDANKETFGFLVNVSELFEIYLVKLLQYRMPDWDVIHEETSEVYQTNFFVRNMKPDIVMKNKYSKKVMIFDAKYKKMTFRGRYENGGDLDRNDFFQINTYMTYYDKKGFEVIAGGLLYPMELDIEIIEQTDHKKAHSDNWFGEDKTKFIIDGIDLSKDDLTIEDISKSEIAFIKRIKDISGEKNESK